MSIFESLSKVRFPAEFIVEYQDGKRETLLRGNGVGLTAPGDDPDGIGDFSARIPKKHPQNQKHCGRVVRFSELQAIYSTDGTLLWPVDTK